MVYKEEPANHRLSFALHINPCFYEPDYTHLVVGVGYSLFGRAHSLLT